jgi:hypothetical protein
MSRDLLGRVVGGGLHAVVCAGWLLALFTLDHWTPFSTQFNLWVFYIGLVSWIPIIVGSGRLAKVLEYKIAGHANPIQSMKEYDIEIEAKNKDRPFGG